MNLVGDAELIQALMLSQDILQAAESANMKSVSSLDAKRQGLVHSFRRRVPAPSAADLKLIQRIQDLNDQSIGLIEHQRRAMERELDMVRAGRRAVVAYANTRRL